MAFSSAFRPGEAIFHDATPESALAPPPGKGRGLLLARRRTPVGAIPRAPRMPRELIIPESEFQERIKEKEERKNRLSDIADRAGLPCKDQQQTNYCWINAPTYALELIRVVQNQPMVILSPASGGARIKNFRNVGGWGEEALEWIVENGLCPVDVWPANHWNSNKFATAANIELAKQYRCLEWCEAEPRNMQELISLLLHNIPVPVGYNWWGHEVTAVDAVWIDGRAWPRIRNSWGMGWGSQGYGILQGDRAPADDAVAPMSAIAA